MNKSSIRYNVSVASTSEHMFFVRMTVELAAAQNSIVCKLPAWIPGSYMIRDFAKHLHQLSCNTSDCGIEQLDKQSWKIHSTNSPQNVFEIEYYVYSFDLSVRSAFLNDQYAFFNPTSLLMQVEDFEQIAHIVNVADFAELPEKVITGLQAADDQYSFRASNYRELVDSPFIIGEVTQFSFEHLGHTFHLVFTGNDNIDCTKIATDLRPIISHHIELFGDFPCEEYYFITLICKQGFGGLEHTNSTVLQFSRNDLPKQGATVVNKAKYQQFLSLCSHELFHTWHVKRIRPSVFHNSDLSAEVYTPQLWIYEGFTSLYDDLSLARSKAINSNEYLQLLAEAITRLYRTPGRQKQSLSTSSFEAWSKFYQQDAGSNNHIVSYYNKGAMMALCLDVELRKQSSDAISLDDVMRALWQQYKSTNQGTSNNAIEQICQQQFGIDLQEFIDNSINTTNELPLAEALAYIGVEMHLRPALNFSDKGGVVKDNVNQGCLHDIGAMFSQRGEFLRVSSIQTSRAASNAGLQIGDDIVALNNYQCNLQEFMHIMNSKHSSSTLPMHVLRDGRLLTLEMPLVPAIADTCELKVIDKHKFESWLWD